MSISAYRGGLANYLLNNQDSSSSNPLTVLAKQFKSYSFSKDSKGKVVLPTMNSLNNVTNPKNKLAIANQMAEVVEMSSDAAFTTGIATRVPTLVNQAKQVLDAMSTAMTALQTKDGSVAKGQTDPALKPYKTTISSALDTLNTALGQLSTLTSKNGKTTAAATNAIIKQLDTQASALAKQAGVTWNSVSTWSKRNATQSINNSTTTDSSKIVDLFA